MEQETTKARHKVQETTKAEQMELNTTKAKQKTKEELAELETMVEMASMKP